MTARGTLAEVARLIAMPRGTRWTTAALTAAMVTAAACATERSERLQPLELGLAERAPAPAPRALGPASQPLEAQTTTGSALALARLDERRLVLVADEDEAAIRVVDAATFSPLSHHRLPGKPSQLVVGGDGRLWVALRDRNTVVALEVKAPDEGAAPSLSQVAELPTPTEPVALATTPDGMTLAVTTAWGRRLVTYAIPSGQLLTSAPLAREPRGVAITADGRHAFVAHAIGSSVSRVPLAAAEPVTLSLAGIDMTPRRFHGCVLRDPLMRGAVDFRGGFGGDNHHDRQAVQGFAVAIADRDVFVPQVLVHRGEVTTGGYGTSASYPSHQPALVQLQTGALDAALASASEGGEPQAGVVIRVMNKQFGAHTARSNFAGGARRDGCFLPRAAAVSEERDLVFVSCLGANEILAFDTEAGPLSTTARGRWQVGSGPVGIAVDDEAGEALVWSQFAGELSRIPLPAPIDREGPPRFSYPASPRKVTAVTALAPLPITEDDPPIQTLSAQLRLGRELFHAAGDPRISADGRACASCHPDGRDDGLSWPTPNGPRQTPMLAGRLEPRTKPFGWQGDAETIAAHLEQTFARLGGKGLTDDELDALVTYCERMATPNRTEPGPNVELVRRGAALFHDETVGCSVCHTDEGYGSDGARHGVGSGPELETPSLAFVAGTGPYFHDGRYATLGELLADSKGKMGWGSHLGDDDLKAIEAYLTTL